MLSKSNPKYFWHPLQCVVIYNPDRLTEIVSKDYIPNQEPPFEKTEFSLMLSVITRYWKQVNEYYGTSAPESTRVSSSIVPATQLIK